MWYLLSFTGSLPGYIIFEFIGALWLSLEYQWFKIIPMFFGLNLVFWDSIFIYFEPTEKLPRKLRRARTVTWSTFPKSWMILTGALMTSHLGFYKHPYQLLIGNIRSTFARSTTISNHVNLSPITLAKYNYQQLEKLQYHFFGTSYQFLNDKSTDHFLNDKSTLKSKQQNSASSTVDFLSFLPDLIDETFEVRCGHLQDHFFDPAIHHCPTRKVYNTFVNGNIGPSFIDPISSSKEFPIIFDSGASVAISEFKDDFISELTRPKTEIRLGGMANGMLVEGIGEVKWSLKSGSNNVIIHTQCYYVPNAKVRLISPQRLFNKKAGVTGSFNIYEEYSTLLFKDLPSVQIDYDEKSFLPIAYARNANFSPELNLSIMNGGNQNLTPAQRLLLQWHYRFGHKGFRLIQQLFRHLPFCSEKFLAAANCEIP